MKPRTSKWPRAGAVVILLMAGFFLQVHFLSTYPQPILFGDPGAYYVVGQKLQQAVQGFASGEDFTAVFESVRGLLYFAGVGSLYGLIDSLDPQNIPYFRVVLSGFNTLAMLGCFFLAWRLSSSYAGGLVALILAVLYPPFSVQTGRLFPDPVTGCLFVWSAYLYLKGVQDRSPFGPFWMFGAGMALTMAVFIRSQLFNYILALLLLVIVATAASWWRSHRKLVFALLLGCLPVTTLWVGIVRVVGDDLEQIEAFGNFTFSQRYPYGFWQFLDSDGWMGPYRLGQEPFYEAMEAEAADVPELLDSYPRQLLFTAGYVASRASESALMFADNIYRLYDRPANDYKWDYPIAYRTQIRYQQVLLIGAIASFAVIVSQNASWALVFFVPACLSLLHGLSYPWPRFNQPAMPIVIAGAGAFAAWAFYHRYRRTKTLLAVGLGAGLLWVAGAALRMPVPELARVLRSTGTLLVLAIPFVFVALPWSDRRRTAASASCFLGLALVTIAHDVRSTSWHETSTRLGKAEQEISLSSEALQRLRRASEAFLVLDLHIPDGDPRGVRVSLNDRTFSSDALEPTMPRFGESTSAGGRNRREYRQWWAIRVTPEDLPEAAPAVLRVVVAAPERDDIVLGGDRFRDQERVYEGPSFGDWPHLVPRIFNYYTKSGSPCVSSVRWAKRAIDSRIWSADLVHLNGFGSSLWASR